MNKQQAENIDKILTLLIKEGSVNPGTAGHLLGILEDDARHLMKRLSEINFNGDKVVNFIGNFSEFPEIEINYNTQKFVDAGGCIRLFDDLVKIEKQEEEWQDLEKQKLLNDIQSFKITQKQYRFTKWTAIISFIIAVVSILLQIFSK